MPIFAVLAFKGSCCSSSVRFAQLPGLEGALAGGGCGLGLARLPDVLGLGVAGPMAAMVSARLTAAFMAKGSPLRSVMLSGKEPCSSKWTFRVRGLTILPSSLYGGCLRDVLGEATALPAHSEPDLLAQLAPVGAAVRLRLRLMRAVSSSGVGALQG